MGYQWGYGCKHVDTVCHNSKFRINYNESLPPPIHHEFVFGVVMVDQSRERTKLCEGLFLRPEG